MSWPTQKTLESMEAVERLSAEDEIWRLHVGKYRVIFSNQAMSYLS